MSTASTIEDLGPWREPFRFDGVATLPDVWFERAERRLIGRKSIFLDPLVESGYMTGKSVLDLGCNSGYWSLACLEGGAARVRGVETDNQRLAQAAFVRERSGYSADRFDLAHADVYEHLKAGDSYDIVLCLGLYYHIEEPMRLMRLLCGATRELLIIDTFVSNVREAAISLRPCATNERYLEPSSIGLEAVASPKAIYWMGIEAGFATQGVLQCRREEFPGSGDYLNGERSTFVLGQGVDLDQVFPNLVRPRYLTPAQDLEKYGYLPERRHVDRGE